MAWLLLLTTKWAYFPWYSYFEKNYIFSNLNVILIQQI